MLLLKPELFVRAAHMEGQTEAPGVGSALLQRICQLTRSDPPHISLLMAMKSADWKTEQGLLLYQGKVYVPPVGQLHYEMLSAHHDTPIAGHPG